MLLQSVFTVAQRNHMYHSTGQMDTVQWWFGSEDSFTFYLRSLVHQNDLTVSKVILMTGEHFSESSGGSDFT